MKRKILPNYEHTEPGIQKSFGHLTDAERVAIDNGQAIPTVLGRDDGIAGLDRLYEDNPYNNSGRTHKNNTQRRANVDRIMKLRGFK